MRRTLLLLTLLVTCLPAYAEPPVDLDDVYRGYAAPELGRLERTSGANVRVLLPEEAAWPADLLEGLERRIAREWDPSRAYGVVTPGVSAKLAYPLVTARMGESVVVPVVESRELPVRGEIDALSGLASRRVALLLDTSASTRRLDRFERTPHAAPWQATWRALDLLFGRAGQGGLQAGLVAFGGRARVLAEPGGPPSLALARIAAERRAKRMRRRGATDAACALWLGRDLIADAPPDHETHLVLVTDGGAPDSARFGSCEAARRTGGPLAGWICERLRNDSACPASRALRLEDGTSDWEQIDHFADELPERVRVHTILLGPGPDADRYLELARRTGGTAGRVVERDSMLEVLRSAIGYRARSVVAVNETTGRRTANLLAADGLRFDGTLPLLEGANDVLLRVERDDGVLTAYRFRVYAEPEMRTDYLDDLRASVRELERRRRRLSRETGRIMQQHRERTLEIRAD